MTDPNQIEACVNVTKGAAALNHLKQNRVEYLVILGSRYLRYTNIPNRCPCLYPECLLVCTLCIRRLERFRLVIGS